MLHLKLYACVLFVFLVFWTLPAFGTEITVSPKGAEDIGSGPARIAHLYAPGGLGGGLGLILGQPNSLTRNDRVLLRFDISKLALYTKPEIRLKKAVLNFRLDGTYIKDIPSDVEIGHLRLDTASGFVGTDLIREPVNVVVELTVNESGVKEYSFDITEAVRSDIKKGYKYTAYRFRDVTAEKDGNILLAPWFVKLVDGNPDIGPSLTLIFDEVGDSK